MFQKVLDSRLGLSSGHSNLETHFSGPSQWQHFPDIQAGIGGAGGIKGEAQVMSFFQGLVGELKGLGCPERERNQFGGCPCPHSGQ